MSEWTAKRLIDEHRSGESWPTLLSRIIRTDIEENCKPGHHLDCVVASIRGEDDDEDPPPYSTDLGAATPLLCDLQHDPHLETRNNVRTGVGLVWSDTLTEWGCGPQGFESVQALGVSEDANNPALAVCRAWLVREMQKAKGLTDA